jgi:hypothetical protein
MMSQLTTERESIKEPTPELPFKRFRIVLIKPSKYDDDGYVIRFWKGVLPSNTLNVLHGLTEEVKDSRVFGDLRIEIVTFDETAEKLPVKKIIRWSRRPSTKLVIGLVGVQTNQFPRAFNLARQFRAAGLDVNRPWSASARISAQSSSTSPDTIEMDSLTSSWMSGSCSPNMLFDALSNRALYSREPLQRFWSSTVEQLRGMRIWNVDPGKLTTNLIKDCFLTTSFALTYRSGSRAE